MTEGMLTLHQVHHPEIEVDGDTATGHWYLQDKVIVEAFKFVLEGAAIYRTATSVRRTAGGSRTPATAGPSSRRYSLDDLPSMKIDGPGVATYASTRLGLRRSARPRPAGRPRRRGPG